MLIYKITTKHIIYIHIHPSGHIQEIEKKRVKEADLKYTVQLESKINVGGGDFITIKSSL